MGKTHYRCFIENSREVLKALREGRGLQGVTEVHSKVNLSIGTVYNHLQDLIEKGLVKKVYTKYVLIRRWGKRTLSQISYQFWKLKRKIENLDYKEKVTSWRNIYRKQTKEIRQLTGLPIGK